jgi:hypothetical protein
MARIVLSVLPALVRGAVVSAAFVFMAQAQTPLPPPQPARPAEPPVRIEIAARPIENFEPGDVARRRFGALEFRGGLELTSPYKEFGGISGLRVLPDGARFIALSDRGRWLRGTIVYKGQRPVGIANAEMAPILGPDGRPLISRGWFDTESLAFDQRTLYVGIERVNRILRFDYAAAGLAARGQIVPVPPEISRLPYNRGLECLAAIPQGMPGAGTLIAVSERGLDAAGNIKGFLIGGANPGQFSVVRSDDFDVSDCAIAPNGELLLLERRFAWTTGVAIRLRRLALSALAPGARVEGTILAFADMGYQIDNMEALAVHRDGSGEIVLTMISDDNFSVLQRTLLLQFTLLGD